MDWTAASVVRGGYPDQSPSAVSLVEKRKGRALRTTYLPKVSSSYIPAVNSKSASGYRGDLITFSHLFLRRARCECDQMLHRCILGLKKKYCKRDSTSIEERVS